MDNKSRIIDLNRKRAITSYINLKRFLKDCNINDNNKKRMRSCCRKLPLLIKNNGLLNTLNFIKEKDNGKNEFSYLYSWIEDWLNRIEDDHGGDIIKKLVTLDNNGYYIYTKEAIQISIWYKRHAESMIAEAM